METRANYVLIGLFTLAVIVGAFSFVYWFSNNSTGTVRTSYRVVFQGPIAGLRTPAALRSQPRLYVMQWSALRCRCCDNGDVPVCSLSRS